MSFTYSPRMVKLILETRLRVPNALKPEIKLANPEILDQLIHHYTRTEHRKLQSLIEDVMHEAGQEWNNKLAIAIQQSSNAEFTTRNGKPMGDTKEQRNQVVYY